MLSDEIKEKLAEKLVDRIEELNTTILEEIGKAIKEIGKLSPSQAYKLAQVMKYGGSSKKIIKKLAQITNLNQKDIRSILTKVAKGNVEFSKPFFKYRGIDTIPYRQNEALKQQVAAISKLTNKKYLNLMNTAAYKVMQGNKAVFTPVSEIYQKTLDKAVITVAQGKESYQTAMRRAMKELTESGIVCVDDDNVKRVTYASGYHRRLDSAVRMNIMDGMRQLTNEMQQEFGKQFNADGVEITVHLNPAPDHEEVQGKQFNKKQFKQLQETGKATTYDGINIDLHLTLKSGKQAEGFRPISTMNCYHDIFSIILGVNKPIYSNERLEKMKKKNHDGFEFEGKKYTMYQGTQLQRAIETKIRTLKDRQIAARARGDKDDVAFCQRNIRQLTNKYNDLCKISGLQPRKNRLSVSGYHSIKVPEIEQTAAKTKLIAIKDNEVFISAEENKKLAEFYYNDWKDRPAYDIRFKERYAEIKEQMKTGFKDEIIDTSTFEGCNKLLNKINGELYGSDIKNMDIKLVSEASKSIYNNIRKCPSWLEDTKINYTLLSAQDLGSDTIAETRMGHITVNTRYYKDYDYLVKSEMENQEMHEYLGGYKNSWHTLTDPDKITLAPITHEQGHIIAQRISGEVAFMKEKSELYEKFGYLPKTEWGGIKRADVEKELIEVPIKRVMQKENISRKEVISKYVSEYGKTDYEEMFAEMFSNSQLGKSNSLGDELIKYLEELGQWK